MRVSTSQFYPFSTSGMSRLQALVLDITVAGVFYDENIFDTRLSSVR